MSMKHYQMAIENYNDRLIQSNKIGFENNNYCETKFVKENETEE